MEKFVWLFGLVDVGSQMGKGTRFYTRVSLRILRPRLKWPFVFVFVFMHIAFVLCMHSSSFFVFFLSVPPRLYHLLFFFGESKGRELGVAMYIHEITNNPSKKKHFVLVIPPALHTLSLRLLSLRPHPHPRSYYF